MQKDPVLEIRLGQIAGRIGNIVSIVAPEILEDFADTHTGYYSFHADSCSNICRPDCKRLSRDL